MLLLQNKLERFSLSNQHTDHYQQTLLEGWEAVYKKSQLTLWILLALKDGPKHMAQIKAFIDQTTNGQMSSDDKSFYRALRRFSQAELIDYTAKASKNGPDKKIYKLTPLGKSILESFIDRNINNIFYNQTIKDILFN